MPTAPNDPHELLVFAAEDTVSRSVSRRNPWLVLIVDDDEEVHRLTRFVLADFDFDDRPVSFLSAYSADEAAVKLRDNPEVAVVLLDVVMEREDAGLELVRTIREELGNRQVRIVLRTGEPGQAPESDVVMRYDVNDYKNKVDLTAGQLRTTLLVSLRDYRDLRAAERSREGMQRVLAAGAALFARQTPEGFVEQVLAELVDLLAEGPGSRGVRGFVAAETAGAFRVRAHRYWDDRLIGHRVATVLPTDAARMVTRVLADGHGVFGRDGYIDVLVTDDGPRHLIYVGWEQLAGAAERDLVRIFMANTALAFRNLSLRQEIVDTQKEIIHTLAEVVETRSSETANHVVRVGLLAARLGELYGLPGPEVDVLRMVAPMHDVGKVGIPDAVLQKPGRLDPDERRIIERHASIGHSILARSDRRIMKAAAIIALEHHERWDGQGYPRRLAGKQIHVYARITALADVFDALSQSRVYRRALPHAEVLNHLAEERGRAFEPSLVDLLLAHGEEIRAIGAAHPDAETAQRVASSTERASRAET